jgi:hypothetical protein
MPLNLPNTVNELINNTQNCLRRVPLSISGQASGARVFYAAQDQRGNVTRPGKYLGNLNPKAATDGMRLWAVPGGFQSHAYYVGMHNWNAGIQPCIIPAPGAAIHNLILTGQLTDCVFSILRMPDGSLSCSHTRPIGIVGGGGGAALYGLVGGQLVGHFRYGPGHGYTNGVHTASIVGVVQNGEWTFYSQRRHRGGNESIVNAKKIFPN